MNTSDPLGLTARIDDIPGVKCASFSATLTSDVRLD